eukprot:3053939-Prymnesium_polylepis.1
MQGQQQLPIAIAAAAVFALLHLRRRPVEAAAPPPPVPEAMEGVVAVDSRCVAQSQPTPTAGEGEVLIRVVATAINRLDTMQRKG